MIIACEISIYCCCDKFFDECIYQIDDLNNFILLHKFNLNLCNYDENSWIFCNLYYKFVKHNSIFKFFSKNLINVITCQNYSSVLKNLITVEKYFIAKYHFIDIIFKLQSDNHFSSVNYNTLQKYMIIISQNFRFLLQIFSSSELRLNNVIKIFWLNKFSSMNKNLKSFLNVQKNKILMILHYFIQHNYFYHDLIINNIMIKNWFEKFILSKIIDNIICLKNSDYYEHEKYTVNLQNKNYKNNLDII